jgi:surface antigen
VNGNPNFKSVSFDAATSVLNVGMANGQTARFNADGTFDMVAGNDATQFNHFNKDGAMVPNDSQGQALAGEASRLAGQTTDDAYQKFAANVLSRFSSTQGDAINAYVSALNQGYLSQLNPTVGVSIQGISGKQVTLLVKSGTGANAATRTVTYTLPA